MDTKERFIELFNKINRNGAPRLLDWLEKSDFFIAPASSQYHLNVAGGLATHSVNVAECLLKLNAQFEVGFSEESLLICGLLHDICKTNYYVKDFKNVKENGEWIKKEVYVIDDKFPLGHGSKSVIMLMSFMKLLPDEMMAITWHMGKWDISDAQVKTLNAAQNQTKLVALMQIADMAATYIMEK